MSIQAINWVIQEEKETKGSERVVLLVLADMANEKNQCYPSLATIASRANITRGQVIRIIKQLETRGILSVKRSKSSITKNEVNIYTILGVVAPVQLGGSVDATRGGSVDATQTININQHNESPGNLLTAKKSQVRDPVLFDIAAALSQVSGIDLEANKARIFREAKELLKAKGVTPEKIIEDYGKGGLWYQVDFRGRGGSPPAINQVRATWGALQLHEQKQAAYKSTGFDTSRETVREFLQAEDLINGG